MTKNPTASFTYTGYGGVDELSEMEIGLPNFTPANFANCVAVSLASAIAISLALSIDVVGSSNEN